MKQVLVLVFCVGAAILSVNGGNVDQYMDMILRSTNTILTQYDEDLDGTVPFKELKASLIVLDDMAKKLDRGPCRTAINSAFDMGHKATNNYFRATDTIFTWCVKAEVIINHIIRNKPERKLMFKSVSKLTTKGVEAVEDSLNQLDKVISQLEEMSVKLSLVLSNIDQELTERKMKEHSITKRMISFSIISFLGAVASLILILLRGSVGQALGLRQTLVDQGVTDEVINREKEPSNKDSWIITESFYKDLENVVKSVRSNVTACSENLMFEIYYVKYLKADMEGIRDVATDFGDGGDLTEDLFPLLETIKKFIERHSRGSNSQRSRREAIITHHGWDVDRISYVVDAYMNATIKEREAQFWKLPDLSVNPDVMSQMYKIAF